MSCVCCGPDSCHCYDTKMILCWCCSLDNAMQALEDTKDYNAGKTAPEPEPEYPLEVMYTLPCSYRNGSWNSSEQIENFENGQSEQISWMKTVLGSSQVHARLEKCFLFFSSALCYCTAELLSSRGRPSSSVVIVRRHRFLGYHWMN